ncbi:hypothetical protein [Acetobacter indonesiensis]|uniref:hypothetical protein n=1 Tax=Acetobacter indonesiensis TaxID=104101 RepID=UPI0039E94C3C
MKYLNRLFHLSHKPVPAPIPKMGAYAPALSWLEFNRTGPFTLRLFSPKPLPDKCTPPAIAYV